VTARSRLTLLFAVMLSVSSVVKADETPLEPAGFRTNDYRAAVPATVNGKAALTTEQAAALWRDDAALFVDTLPQPPRPTGLPSGTIWRPKPRYDIPNSIWLPDTGYGELPATMETYFRVSLRDATEDDRSRHLVFYCLARCWMSWNAAKRAAALGYTQVDWYADGTDGWAAHNLPLELRDPTPRPSQQDAPEKR
jgi:PQQ-dependent catabolism-associated CXXCW motif protein